jgi:hypothetical protein
MQHAMQCLYMIGTLDRKVGYLQRKYADKISPIMSTGLATNTGFYCAFTLKICMAECSRAAWSTTNHNVTCFNVQFFATIVVHAHSIYLNYNWLYSHCNLQMKRNFSDYAGKSSKIYIFFFSNWTLVHSPLWPNYRTAILIVRYLVERKM